MSATGEGLFVLSAYEQAYLALAEQLAVDGKGRADYKAVFPVSIVSTAGSNLLPHLNTVDGDLVAPYVAAWVNRGRQTGEKFTAVGFQKAASIVVGSTPNSRAFAANAMLRALANGRIKGEAYTLIADPANFTGDLGGDLRDILATIGKAGKAVIQGAGEGVEATSSFLKYAPWIALGLGAAYVVWMSAPVRSIAGGRR